MENQQLTQIIAIYGAFVATVSLVLSIVLGINELRRNQPKITVGVHSGRLLDDHEKNSEPMIMVDVVNHGQLDVTITGFGWLLKGGNKHMQIHPYLLTLPAKLNPRQTITVPFAYRWFRKFEDQYDVTAFFFQDATGNTWKRSVSKKQIKEWVTASVDGKFIVEWNENQGIWTTIYRD